MVAAPTFPLSCEDAPGGTSGADLASQPGDVAFVVREVLERARTRDSELYGLVDADRVALAGKSFGAITVLEAGYNPAEQVPNIRAVMALTGVALEGAQFEAIDTPLLLEHGDEDALVPCSASQARVRPRPIAEVLRDAPWRRPRRVRSTAARLPPKSSSSERPSPSWIATCWETATRWIACCATVTCPASRRSQQFRSGA